MISEKGVTKAWNNIIESEGDLQQVIFIDRSIGIIDNLSNINIYTGILRTGVEASLHIYYNIIYVVVESNNDIGNNLKK